jgi:hypothetical protein
VPLHNFHHHQYWTVPTSAKIAAIYSWGRCYDFKKYFRRKIWRKQLAILTPNAAILWQKLIIILVYKKNAIFSPIVGENRRK